MGSCLTDCQFLTPLTIKGHKKDFCVLHSDCLHFHDWPHLWMATPQLEFLGRPLLYAVCKWVRPFMAALNQKYSLYNLPISSPHGTQLLGSPCRTHFLPVAKLKWAPLGPPMWGPDRCLYGAHIGPLQACWLGFCLLSVQCNSWHWTDTKTR